MKSLDFTEGFTPRYDEPIPTTFIFRYPLSHSHLITIRRDAEWQFRFLFFYQRHFFTDFLMNDCSSSPTAVRRECTVDRDQFVADAR